MSRVRLRRTLPATPPGRQEAALASPSLVLFFALFASQSAVLVLSPILGAVAADFGVSIATAGQLRIVAAPLAAVVALAAGRLLRRFSLRALLGAGCVLLGAGSLASAAAPTFALLALAQIPLWAGIATVLTAGVSAAGAWSEPERRTKVIAHAFAGAPAAWIVGMPVIGLVATVHWRLAFVALPLPAAIVAGLAVVRRPAEAPLAADGASLGRFLSLAGPRRWAIGEVCANAAWAGTLVFSGALFTELYHQPPTTTGFFLAGLALAYLAGNQLAARSRPAHARGMMLGGSIGAAALVGLTWAVTPGVAVTFTFFALTSLVVALRMVAGTVHGFGLAGEQGREVGMVRAASTQVGYLAGSLAGGAALALGGMHLLAFAFGGLFLASTLPYVRALPRLRPVLVATPQADAA